MVFPPKVWKDFFQKNFSWRKNIFGQKAYGEVILYGKNNDQIMPKWGKSFITDKSIFQQSEHCKCSLED